MITIREELDNLQNQALKLANELEYSGRRVEHIWMMREEKYHAIPPSATRGPKHTSRSQYKLRDHASNAMAKRSRGEKVSGPPGQDVSYHAAITKLAIHPWEIHAHLGCGLFSGQHENIPTV